MYTQMIKVWLSSYFFKRTMNAYKRYEKRWRGETKSLKLLNILLHSG